jgi:hypothetical protein
VRTALLALLALAALVLSVLAMHSAPSPHVMGIPLPVSSSNGAEHEMAPASAGMAHAGSGLVHAGSGGSAPTSMAAPHPVGTAMTNAALVATAMTSLTSATALAASHDGMLDCALMVMGCVTLLVLAALTVLRRPALTHRAVAAGRNMVSRVVLVDAPSHRPLLTVLCIRRV